MLAVEAAMRAYARHFGEDEERWALAGLLAGLLDAHSADAALALVDRLAGVVGVARERSGRGLVGLSHIAVVAGAVAYFAFMLVLRGIGAMMAASDPDCTRWRGIIGRVLAKTGVLFMIAAKVAFPPQSDIEHVADTRIHGGDDAHVDVVLHSGSEVQKRLDDILFERGDRFG